MQFDVTGRNTLGRGIVVQIVDGKYHTVWPFSMAPQVWTALKSATPAHARLSLAADKIRFAAQYLLGAAVLAVMAFEAHESLASA